MRSQLFVALLVVLLVAYGALLVQTHSGAQGAGVPDVQRYQIVPPFPDNQGPNTPVWYMLDTATGLLYSRVGNGAFWSAQASLAKP